MREVRKMQANYVKDIAQVQKKISSLVSQTLRRQYSPVDSPIGTIHQPRNVDFFDCFVLIWGHRTNLAWLS